MLHNLSQDAATERNQSSGSRALGEDGLMTSESHILERRWQECASLLDGFESLRDNWDGEGAKAPSLELLASARDLLAHLKTGFRPIHVPPTDIVASPFGGVLFEWQDEQSYLEVEIKDPFLAEWMLMREGEPAEHWPWHSSDWREDSEPTTALLLSPGNRIYAL